MDFLEALETKRLFFDGAMGTMLQAAGLKAGELPETWNLSHPDVVQGIHAAYLKNGADIIKTNTFGCNRLKFSDEKGTPTVTQLVTAAVDNVKKAMTAAGKEGYVALDMGPTGRLLQPYGDLPFEEAVSLYAEQVEAGKAAGADLILIETMSDSYEAKAAILAAKEHSDLPIVVTFTFDQDGKLLNGASLESAMILAEALGAAATGFNCGLGPKQVAALFGRAKAAVSLPLVVNPNAGLPVERDGETIFPVGPEEYASLMTGLAKDGAAILGGCCGTTPEHIRLMTNAVNDIPLPAPREAAPSAITGYGTPVNFETMPVIIGERINPTGKKRLKEALKAENMDYVCELALEQLDKGAQVLDVNVGVPGVDEPALLEKTVKTLQSITAVPLQIDTSNPQAMERALRVYNGRPLLNSVNGKEESLAEVLPIAKKYGAMLVGLCLDDEGIAESAEKRLAVADKIIDRADKIGIPARDLLIDPLAMTISTGAMNAQIDLAIITALKARNIKTVMGVSNISFGLPHRDGVNSTFFGLAMQAGLSAGIVNPNSAPMMEAWYSFGALRGYDTSCQNYINYFAGQEETKRESASVSVQKAPAAGQKAFSLDEAIVKGLIGPAETAVRKLLEDGKKPLDIINEYMIPALDRVGDAFEKKTLFLPQLLMSADAAKAGFEILKEKLQSRGTTKKGKPVIVATVKGDIHDIGKNIVKVLLENYGFDVIDLGRDVPPETIVETAKKRHVHLIGLSALMTTTVGAMEDTIKLVHRELPDCRVMVGGAVLTDEYAKSIGADCYAPNAVASVHYATKILNPA
jgi:5-methyltetrahydrofolate--homocysteine methyltransferase